MKPNYETGENVKDINSKSSTVEKSLVKMVNIHKWFGKVHALKGVDFQVGYSEIVGLVGDNGAGKSTLIKVLSGVHIPDEGEIYFEGKKVNITSPAYARKLGIETVYQEQALAPHMSISRNIFMGREPSLSFGFINRKKMNEENTRIEPIERSNSPQIISIPTPRAIIPNSGARARKTSMFPALVKAKLGENKANNNIKPQRARKTFMDL